MGMDKRKKILWKGTFCPYESFLLWKQLVLWVWTKFLSYEKEIKISLNFKNPTIIAKTWGGFFICFLYILKKSEKQIFILTTNIFSRLRF